MRPTPRLLVAVLALGLVGAACASESDDTATDDTAVAATGSTATDDSSDIGTVTVYSGRGEDLVGPLLEMFENETGIDTEVRYGDSAEMLLLIQEEGDNSPADVYYSQGAGFLGELSSNDALADPAGRAARAGPPGAALPQRRLGRAVGSGPNRRLQHRRTDRGRRPRLDPRVHRPGVGRAHRVRADQRLVPGLRHRPALPRGRGCHTRLARGHRGQRRAVREQHRRRRSRRRRRGVASGSSTTTTCTASSPRTRTTRRPTSSTPTDDPGSLVNIAGAGVLATTDEEAGALALIEFLLSPTAQAYFATETFEIPVTDDVEIPEGVPTLDSLNLPEFDLNQLLDLQGTVDLLIEVGAL